MGEGCYRCQVCWQFQCKSKEYINKSQKKCASGGTVRDNEVELQGDHRFKMKKFLIDEGFPEENILIQE